MIPYAIYIFTLCIPHGTKLIDVTVMGDGWCLMFDENETHKNIMNINSAIILWNFVIHKIRSYVYVIQVTNGILMLIPSWMSQIVDVTDKQRVLTIFFLFVFGLFMYYAVYPMIVVPQIPVRKLLHCSNLHDPLFYKYTAPYFLVQRLFEKKTEKLWKFQIKDSFLSNFFSSFQRHSDSSSMDHLSDGLRMLSIS